MNIILNRFSKKSDIVNSMAASKTFQSCVGTTILMTGYAFLEKLDESTGEMLKVATIKDSENNFYSTISKTAINSLEGIHSMEYSDEALAAGVPIEFCASKSKSNRDFVYLKIND